MASDVNGDRLKESMEKLYWTRTVVSDVSSREDEAMIELVVSRFGRLDGVVPMPESAGPPRSSW